jgi:hypothetical protein
MKNFCPPIAFLGVCDRAAHMVQPPSIVRYNFQGVSNYIFSIVFPMNLKDLYFLFSIYDPSHSEGKKINVIDSKNQRIMSINITTNETNNTSKEKLKESKKHFTIPINNFPHSIIFPYKVDIDAVIRKPTTLKIYLETSTANLPIGCVGLHYAKAQPFTTEYKEAIRSNPFAAKDVRMLIKCNLCGSEIKPYVSLDPVKELEHEGNVWFQSLPSYFKCKCEKTKINLNYIRENMHALLGNVKRSSSNVSFTSLYDEDALQDICHRFKQLIDSNPLEERVQKFIEKNQVILQTFSPERLFFKKPILTFFETDFCIVNSKKELIFIEIEKPETPIMKQDGGMRSEMQHAINQVRDWLFTSKEERTSVLKCIGLKSEDINKIRGVVILGRDQGYDLEKLRKLKGHHLGEVEFYTYDDIISTLTNLIRQMRNL